MENFVSQNEEENVLKPKINSNLDEEEGQTQSENSIKKK